MGGNYQQLINVLSENGKYYYRYYWENWPHPEDGKELIGLNGCREIDGDIYLFDIPFERNYLSISKKFWSYSVNKQIVYNAMLNNEEKQSLFLAVFDFSDDALLSIINANGAKFNISQFNEDNK